MMKNIIFKILPKIKNNKKILKKKKMKTKLIFKMIKKQKILKINYFSSIIQKNYKNYWFLFQQSCKNI